MKAIIIIVVLALIAWGAYALMGNNEVETPAVNNVEQNDQVSPAPTPPATVTSAVKEFTVSAKNFSFTPANIQVNEGDTVRITFQNQAGNHDWVIDEFSARTKVLTGGQSETIEFVANKTGTFEYYCSVGTHRQMGMVGKLIVQ